METDKDTNLSMILVMGVTGSGKSYFINKLSEGSVDEGIGLRSKTEKCQVVRVGVGKREVAVVDTPGFDDTTRSDTEILEEIVEFLCIQHKLGIPLKGIIYMHRITDNKMSGSAQRYFAMFSSLCGEKNFGNVVLLTTMWSELKDEGRGVGRQRELRNEFWKDMEDKGSTIRRFDGSRSMAEAFVCRLLRKKDVVLSVQSELLDHGKRLEETMAGRLIVPRLDQSIVDSQKKIEKLDKLIDGAQDSDGLEIGRHRKERGALRKKHRRSVSERRRLEKRPGLGASRRIEEKTKSDKWQSRLAIFGSLLGLVITATVNVVLPLAGIPVSTG